MALQLWLEMQRKGLEPDVITCSALINACAKGDYAEKTLQLWVEMQPKGMEPNVITYVITYNAPINAGAKGDSNAGKTSQLLAGMQRKGLEPDVFTYNALTNALHSLSWIILSNSSPAGSSCGLQRAMGVTGALYSTVTTNYTWDSCGTPGASGSVCCFPWGFCAEGGSFSLGSRGFPCFLPSTPRTNKDS